MPTPDPIPQSQPAVTIPDTSVGSGGFPVPVIPSSAVVIPPPNLPPEASVLIPDINAGLDTLATMPAGPQAEAKKVELGALFTAFMKVVQAAATNPAVQTAVKGFVLQLPATWQSWVAHVVAILAMLGLGGGVGRYVFPSIPTAIVAPEGKDKTSERDKPKGPAELPAPHKLILYVTTGMDTKALLSDPALKGLPVTISVFPQTFTAGEKVGWGGKQIPIPCAELNDAKGKTIDVEPFTNAADLAAWVGKSLGK